MGATAARPGECDTLSLLRCRFLLSAAVPLTFGEAGAANDFRGALGLLLPEAWFRPTRAGGPSGMLDPPRPFVLRAPQERRVAPYVPFSLDVHLFDPAGEQLLEQAVARAAKGGLGPARTPLRLQDVHKQRVTCPLSPGGRADRIEVRFLTATELKGWEAGVWLPFSVLLGRARDRISALLSTYGPGSPGLDFVGLGQRAALVETVACRLDWERRERFSTRTGQRHPLGGFTGEAVFAGALGEFLPILKAAEWTGVGRQTVWGKGQIAVTAVGS